jgi:hypothetical protein
VTFWHKNHLTTHEKRIGRDFIQGFIVILNKNRR